MSLTEQTKHLKQYFSDEQLSALTDTEKIILFDEFSNTQLREIAHSTPEEIKAILSSANDRETARRFSYIHPEEVADLMPWYLGQADEVEELHCTNTKAHKKSSLIGLVIKHKTLNSNDANTFRHHEGRFVVPVGPSLMSYRPRLDEIMGFQCACGNDTLWSKIEVDNIPQDHIMSALAQDDIIRVKHQMNVTSYVPKVEKTKLGYKLETFELRKVQ